MKTAWFFSSLLLLLAGPLFGAVLPDDKKEELITDFSGGLNTTDPSHKLATSYSPYMRNVFVDSGRLERPRGFDALGSTPTLKKITGIFPFVRENGQTTFLVTDSSLTLETADYKTWTFVSSVSAPGALLLWMQVRNKMWGFNGVDFPRTWDGTTMVILNGLLNTPAVPKFRFGAYYQDRVWGYSIPNGASDLYFTSVVTTDAIIIAPDDSRAWPAAINALYVGRGDGQIGTGLFTYQGLLRAGKQESIYTIYGDQPSNYFPRKEEANVGIASQETVRILDGQSHFLSQDGIFRNVTRISDAIVPDVDMFNKSVTNIVQNTWESDTDFIRGLFYSLLTTNDGVFNSTATGGFVKGINGSADEGNKFHASFISNDGIPSPQALSASTTFFKDVLTTTTPLPYNFNGYFDHGRIQYLRDGGGSCGTCVGLAPLQLTVKNETTGSSQTFLLSGGCAGAVRTDINPASKSLGVNGSTIHGSSFTYKYEIPDTPACPGWGATVWISTRQDSYFTPYSTGQYISDIATLTSVTAWGNFESVRNTNGGSIDYFYRTSTSVITMANMIWRSISPGSVISTSTANNFVQWSASFTLLATAMPEIDNVTISHIEGQSSDARAVAMDWQNRYWLSVTTTSNSAQRLMYVKSYITNKNPDAWMPIEGYPVPLAKANNVFYGGSPSTGTVYRLDYGTNFDGAAFQSIYHTPDMPLGDYFFDKYILKYLIDGEKSGNGVMTVGSSVDEGAFSNSTFTISGTGRFSRIIEGVTGKVKTLRLGLINGEKDIDFIINNIDILYKTDKGLSNK